MGRPLCFASFCDDTLVFRHATVENCISRIEQSKVGFAFLEFANLCLKTRNSTSATSPHGTGAGTDLQDDEQEVCIVTHSAIVLADLSSARSVKMDVVNIEFVEGRLKLRDQTREYMDRGHALDDMCYLDFFLDTYDGKTSTHADGSRGRVPNARVPYLEGRDRDGHCRIIRSPGHETMPYFPGPWFPKQNTDEINGLFDAAMLALLKPWRSLSDVKGTHHCFRDAYDEFRATASQHVLDMIDNIGFHYECSDTVNNRADSNAAMIDNVSISADDPDHNANVLWTTEASADEGTDYEPVIMEEAILSAADNPYNAAELLHADVAVSIGREAGALDVNVDCLVVNDHASPASAEQLVLVKTWEETLNGKPSPFEGNVVDSAASNATVTQLDVLLNAQPNVHIGPSVTELTSDTPHLQSTNAVACLNNKQKIVHTIIANNLRAHLQNLDPPQILMVVHGQGGTGKTTLLNAISKTFDEHGTSKLFAKTAMSGVAASLIGGQTLHSWAALPITSPTTEKWATHPSKDVERRRKDNIGNTLWLTIDEKSMMTAPTLAYLSQVSGIVRSNLHGIDAGKAFGGLNVVLLGDFHQFPPVANPKKELYNSNPPPGLCKTGRALYEQFDTVVKLDEQMRVRDHVWNDILQRTRTGDCTSADIAEIKKLVLLNPDCDKPNFSEAPWDNAILVTPRNAVRALWNNAMLVKHCKKSGNKHYVFYAVDSVNHQPLSRQQCFLIANMKLKQTGNLANRVDFAIGMKAMILANIATEADLANGSRGVITDIILHPDEVLADENTDFHVLTYPPVAVLFQPLHGHDTIFPGLPHGIIPVFASEKKFGITQPKKSTVERIQFALTPAYAFTDYKSQGQTMECVIIDLAKPPTGALTNFNAYVALSRSRGRDTIRLLRDVDEKLFTSHPSEELRKEDARLMELEEASLARFNAGLYGPRLLTVPTDSFAGTLLLTSFPCRFDIGVTDTNG